MAREFYKTTFTVEVLSEKPFAPDDTDLESIGYEITEGACSGTVKLSKVKKLTQKQVERALVRQGSNPEFFDSGIREPKDNTRYVNCSVCHEDCDADDAHLHQGKWIGDECCWDDRLYSSE